VRAGRRVATGEARLVQSGKEIVRAGATFADLDHASDRVHMRSQPPVRVPLPRAARLGRRPGEPGARSALLAAVPRRHAADLFALAAMVDAAAPAVLELGVQGSATIELTVHLRATPAPGWLACRAFTRHAIGEYHDEDFEIWDSTGALVAQSRQFALLL
jgi:acyl-CoA thioesterase